MKKNKIRPPRLSLWKKIRSLPNKFLQTLSIEGKSSFAYGLPNQIMVEPSSICNLRCPTCICTHNTGFRPNTLMSFENFKMIVDQVHSFVTKMPLVNYGEPFLNPDLTKMIKYAHDSGIYTITNTNGQFTLSSQDYARLVKSGLKHLIFSLDGLDQKTVEKFRRGIKIEECIGNLKNIIAAKRKLNSPTPFIDLQFIVMKYNSGVMGEIKKFGEESGVDRVLFKSMWVSPLFDNWEELFNEFIPTEENLTRYKGNDSGISKIKPNTAVLCKVPWESCVINSDGSVVACCYDLRNQEVFGNVFERPFKEIWNGKKFSEFRERMMTQRDSIEICRSCSKGMALNLEQA